MASFFKKLLFSNLINEQLGHKVLSHQWQNAKDIWNNSLEEKSNAIGIERLLKLVLILSQFGFPGIYIRAIFGRWGKLSKHVGVEIHVVLKFIIALTILFFGIYKLGYSIFGHSVVLMWSCWMILETIFYTGNLIFSSDVFAKPHSNKRNLILIMIDYITINLDFATIYLISKSLKTYETLNNQSVEVIITNARDAIYFSFISSLTIGYGDITPNLNGRNIVILHSLTMLLFGVLFINFYLSKITSNKI